MKSIKILKTAFCCFFIIGFINTTEAQFWKKLKKRAGQAAEETIKRKVEEKTAEKTEQAMDSLFEAPKKIGKINRKKSNKNNNKTPHANESESYETESNNKLAVYSNFDFVPGNKILSYNDFSLDNVGDFPASWDTNGSGEIVTFDEDPQHWFALSNNSSYITHQNPLPEEYTIEFDLAAYGISKKTTSNTELIVTLDESNGYKTSNTNSSVAIPFCQYIDAGIKISKTLNGKRQLFNIISKDIREAIVGFSHVSIAVNKTRFRMWINQTKVIDVPRLLNEGKAKYLKLNSKYFKHPDEQIFITNVKIAEGGLDLRAKLLEEGSFSTTGILFNSGSAAIKPASFGVLTQIAEALANGDIQVKIIGHTDADGDEDLNLSLSEKRAKSVKNILVTQFGIDASLIETEGKGETNPVANNNTVEGKAQNRRVEFIKL